jgi:hypothetical protein
MSVRQAAVFDAVDDIVYAFDDLTPLIQRERPFGHIDFGDRHDDSSLIGKYLATLCLGRLCVKLKAAMRAVFVGRVSSDGKGN